MSDKSKSVSGKETVRVANIAPPAKGGGACDARRGEDLCGETVCFGEPLPAVRGAGRPRALGGGAPEGHRGA